ncbi:hypothetical protein L228DRAFT_281586 [Xylona heveae TC161]|uniref:Maintenance of telomere capping protein 1 n=1 Tax=Xylona heveae (strain CBS 132557 / TC161) TaxID=1328760 RepID=A0A165I842_XYLHT|nr:hypothetical protein L228DRAFT_281586 [Xylona heveae TC161]KZF24522.1 hypothetical protein L228DRAFT_281586 [Xylona heveae TC161]
MAEKKNTEDEISKLFEGIENNESTPGKDPKSTKTTATMPDPQAENDLLAELGNLAAERPASRSHTPRAVSSSNRKSPMPAANDNNGTPPPPAASERTSEDKLAASTSTLPRKSGESTRPLHRAATPNEFLEKSSSDSSITASQQPSAPSVPPTAQQQQQQSNGGGWWGGIFATASATASAAVKQAEAAVKEIQKNEEAQRWAEQVKGNVGLLKGIGGELRSRALPTFTNILHHIAPPISTHERLQIHITHDLVGYPSLDPLIYQTFSRVMAQVEGGDLMVIQRGRESAPRRGSDVGFTGGSSSGWNDGPWWRSSSEARDIGSVKGIVEGTKLARASAESYANQYFGSRGGVEAAAKQATEVLSETNPVRSSDIFLAIQAIGYTLPEDLFDGPKPTDKPEAVEDPDDKPDELVTFAIYLHDPIHGIDFKTVTQAFPQQWINWLDARSGPVDEEGYPGFPEEIAEIIETGGVDPREWVSEWVEEVLALGVGTVAQRYVAKRMGVGQGGIGRGKAKQAIESGAGEAARAI